MTALSFPVHCPAGTRVIDAATQLRLRGYRLTLPRSGFLAVRRHRNDTTPPRAA